MPRKTGHSRLQYGLFATPLEEMIAPDNMVRVIDAFGDSLDLGQLGFKAQPSELGASSYEPATLLKIYLYGYLNRVRSSRRLELECRRNVEMMWLAERQEPSYHTISTFRTFQEKDDKGKTLFCHRKALKGVFRCFVAFCNGAGLLGKETVAVDGTKIAAQNSRKKHISADKIARKMERAYADIEYWKKKAEDGEAWKERAIMAEARGPCCLAQDQRKEAWRNGSLGERARAPTRWPKQKAACHRTPPEQNPFYCMKQNFLSYRLSVASSQLLVVRHSAYCSQPTGCQLVTDN